MTTYNAPVEDMMFLFDNLKDNKNYKEIDKFKEISSDLVKDVLDQAAKINQEIVHPLAKIGDDSPCVYENGIVKFKGKFSKYIKKKNNSIVDALAILRERNLISDYYSVLVDKKIPVFSGMGGGTSNAACLIKYLTRNKINKNL